MNGDRKSVLVSSFIAIMPVESCFVELDNSLEMETLILDTDVTTHYDHLGNLQIGLLGRHQVRLLRPLPLDQEEKVSRLVGSAYDLVWLQASRETAGLCLLGFLRTYIISIYQGN